MGHLPGLGPGEHEDADTRWAWDWALQGEVPGLDIF